MGGLNSKKEPVIPNNAESTVVGKSDNTWSEQLDNREHDTILSRIAEGRNSGLSDLSGLVKDNELPPSSIQSEGSSGESVDDGRDGGDVHISASPRYVINIDSNWKNRNLCNTDFVWTFTSYFDKSSWIFMPPDTNNQTEILYQKYLQGEDVNNECVILPNGGRLYYNFNKMTQKNPSTGTLRYIYRMSDTKYSQLRNDYIKNIISRSKIWVLSTSTEYIIYSPAIQDALDNAMEQGTTETSIELNSYKYIFNLVNMTQTNDSTSKIRTLDHIDPAETRDKPINGSFEFVYT